MLRVGLTGGLGSGKSTVAAMLARHGAHVLSADEVGRRLMEPGQAVFSTIRNTFGPTVVRSDGSLDRAALAHLAFTDGRVEELNAIVHPAVLAHLAGASAAIAAHHPSAVIVVESALIFETQARPADATPGDHDRSWRRRFDRLILVAAPEDLKIQRFVERSSRISSRPQDVSEQIADARRRLAHQIDDTHKAPLCDYILRNDSSLTGLQSQVDALWPTLVQQARNMVPSGGSIQ